MTGQVGAETGLFINRNTKNQQRLKIEGANIQPPSIKIPQHLQGRVKTVNFYH
jgi:hypothetical protein